MPVKKNIKVEEATVPNETPKPDVRKQLKLLLTKKMPPLFDRDPALTGNLDPLVDEIINLF